MLCGATDNCMLCECFDTGVASAHLFLFTGKIIILCTSYRKRLQHHAIPTPPPGRTPTPPYKSPALPPRPCPIPVPTWQRPLVTEILMRLPHVLRLSQRLSALLCGAAAAAAAAVAAVAAAATSAAACSSAAAGSQIWGRTQVKFLLPDGEGLGVKV